MMFAAQGIALLLAFGAAEATPQTGPVDAALETAVERVCKPFLLAKRPDKDRAMAAAAAVGFRRATREESLAGIGEDLVAELPPSDRGRVTVTLLPEDGAPACSVAVQGDPASFDRYLDALLAEGWRPAGSAVLQAERRNEWLWSPDGGFTIVAGRYAGKEPVAPASQVLGMVMTRGREPIPPICGASQPPPCLMVR